MRRDDGSGVAKFVSDKSPSPPPVGTTPGSSIQASAIFVSIAGLTSMDGPTAHAAMSALHRVLREALVAPARVPGLRVLSCLTGAIVLVPDDAGVEVTELFARVAPRIVDAGLAVHAGIAHGHVELLEDADGTLNAVGVCLNVAARLAYAKANTGVLVHESYADHIAGVLTGDHWLHPGKRSAADVAGKRQEVFRCFAASAGTVAIRADCSVALADPRPTFVNAVLLAYDLPSFSEGDAQQLASRFRSVVQEVRRMRTTSAIPQGVRFSFSPGGDGAVLALADLHVSLAHEMAERLERLLKVETLLKAEGADVEARISVHYGPVFLYESAEGASRPTGTTLFDADSLAGDDEAKKYDAVIVSGALIDLAAYGSRAYQDDHFEAIGALPRSHGRDIRRFVRRTHTRPPAPSGPSGPSVEHVEIARLPIPGEYLFGRDEEIARLNACWSDAGTRVVSIVAMGGAGKTALVDAWLKRMQTDGWRGAERVFGCSFYSQGSSNTASGETSIAEMLRWFGDTDPTAGSAWDKGERLARLVKQRRTLLVLDGLEPLQAPPGPDEGKIRDLGVAALVRELAAGGRGLCVISSRLAVADLAAREDGSAPRIDLDQLSPEDGAKLLEALGATGPNAELKDASREVRGHALALTLLGSYLADACAGDIRKRREIGPLDGDVRKGEHAKRVMEAYAHWLREGPAVAVLRLLGLFDRPANEGCIRALRAAPAIPKLTDAIVEMSEVHWNQTLAKLRRAHLVAEASATEPGALDAHPFVREHFGARLREELPAAWREGHGRLFEYLQTAAPEFPENAIAMAPLYAAVVHGCHAGRQNEALTLLGKRIQRGDKYFNSRKLGAFDALVAVLAAFFDPPWTRLASGLHERSHANVFNQAGVALRAVGRLEESTEPTRLAVEAYRAKQNWKEAARNASNLSELQAMRGSLDEAIASAQQSIELADRSTDISQQSACRTVLANAMHQKGRLAEARLLYEEAEVMQKARQPEYPILSSLRGFRYCELLLELGEHDLVVDRATRTLELGKPAGILRDIALDHISLGRALLARQGHAGDHAPARAEFDEAVRGLRQAGRQNQLPRGLLARAELHLATGDLAAAERDLDEAFLIAARGGMRLHEADAQLGFARLHLARGDRNAARARLAAAKAIVERTGYHRRDRDLAEVEAAL